MSYNITFEVTDDGKVVVDEEASYTVTAPRGKFTVSGHVVGEDEKGHQYAALRTPLGEVASGGHDVK